MKHYKLTLQIVLFIGFLFLMWHSRLNLHQYTLDISYYALRSAVYMLIGSIGVLILFHFLLKKFLQVYYLSLTWFYILNGILFIVFVGLIINYISFGDRFYVHTEPPKTYYEFLLCIFGIVATTMQILHFRKFLIEK